jgi:soluble lytic murein transglycosylase-like protein
MVQPAADSTSSNNFSTALQNAAISGISGQSETTVNPSTPSLSDIRPISGISGKSSYDNLIQQSAEKYGVSAGLIKAVMDVESGGNPNVVSKAGAMGLMQLMPSNASENGVSDPFDPAQNIDAGAKDLSKLLSLYNGNLDLALSAYNAGPGAVNKYGGTPPYPETQNYVKKVKDILAGNK